MQIKEFNFNIISLILFFAIQGIACNWLVWWIAFSPTFLILGLFILTFVLAVIYSFLNGDDRDE